MTEYWHVGDWAFGYYEGDGYWYPVEIKDINDDELTIRYDYDNSEETVTADDLEDYETEEGEPGAECYSDDDGLYYAVNVKEVGDNHQVLVEFEDGTASWVDLSYLRFEAQEEDEDEEEEYWEVGDWAFAYYEGDGYWYPVEIKDINDDELTIRYDYDDSVETVTADDLEDYETEEGEPGAECYWDDDGLYYAVNVKEVGDNDQVLVEFEDGTASWVDLSYLRFEGQ